MMSMIPEEKVAEVRERANIVDVIGEYVALRKSGANFQGLCPFHGEKTPSFNVNPARGIFHCFGCGVGGNALTFIMKVEGLSFPEAVRFLAKRVGVEIEDRAPTASEQRRQDERELLFRINEAAARYYRRVLMDEPAGESARRYLERRGVTTDTSEAYRLGFAPERWDGLTRHLEQQRLSLQMAEQLGIIRRRDSGGYYDIFRNRLIFVISDPQGRAIGFGGRVLDDSLPKYINSPESVVYRKSEVLFGVDLAKHAMRESDEAIIVEGYFDHLALYQAGVRNVVASCGTALTPGHLKLLQRYAGRFVTLFDSDSAGKKATLRAMELFLGEGAIARVVELTAGDDPDSFLQRDGVDAFRVRLGKGAPIFAWYLNQLLLNNESGTVDAKVRLVDELIPQLKKINNPVERDLYIKEISRLLAVDLRLLQQRLGGDKRILRGGGGVAKVHRSNMGTAEMLLALMGKYPQIAGRVAEYGVSRLFPEDLLSVAEAILESVAAGRDIDWGLILEQVEIPEERSRLAALFVDERHLEDIDPLKAFEECRQSSEKASLSSAKALRLELARLDVESPRYLEILKELDELRNRKSRLI
jgi:DNA primase